MMAIDHIQRRTVDSAWSHHHLEHIFDNIHYYHVVVDILANLLKQEQINLVLFLDAPHLFYDTVIYQIAKATGIETLILTDSVFENRFFSTQAIEDQGHFPIDRDSESTKSFHIDPSEIQSWYYMDGVKQYRGEFGELCWRGILSLVFNLLISEKKIFLQPSKIYRLVNRMRNISSSLPKWRYPFLHYFHPRHLNYFETLLEFEDQEVNLNCEYVYFPLQLQPELTTSTLGGGFSDQVLAIEKVADIIPDKCFIYVKENPKQSGHMRSANFMKRLLSIKNVRFLPSYIDTTTLIDNSEFVATITGTVGWEAMRKGKNVLVFGFAWYRSLTGAITYYEGITYEEICNFTIQHELLEQATGYLFARSHEGLITHFGPNDRDDHVDLESNAKVVAKSVIDIIERRNTITFTRL